GPGGLELVVLIVVVHLHDLTPAVGAAGRADAVRQARAVARRARVVGRRRDLVLGAALGRARVRLLLLGDGHGRPRRVEHRGLASLPACATSRSAPCATRTWSTPTASAPRSS